LYEQITNQKEKRNRQDPKRLPLKKQSTQKPKPLRGKRKIMDETFKDTAEFKETEQGEIKE
jgi:hypothetical protein